MFLLRTTQKEYVCKTGVPACCRCVPCCHMPVAFRKLRKSVNPWNSYILLLCVASSCLGIPGFNVAHSHGCTHSFVVLSACSPVYTITLYVASVNVPFLCFDFLLSVDDTFMLPPDIAMKEGFSLCSLGSAGVIGGSSFTLTLHHGPLGSINK